MKSKKSFATLTALTTAAALAVLPAIPAQAAEDPAITSARSFLSTYGADEKTQDRLIDTYLAGGTWDSMSSASDAVSVVEYTRRTATIPSARTATARSL